MRGTGSTSLLKSFAALSSFLCLLLGGASGASASTLLPDREADPVVLTGADTPRLAGIAPGDVVAFRWNGAWDQVPVQLVGKWCSRANPRI